MRERLIELLAECRCIEGCGEDLLEKQAAHLLANGIIVPPCKVGDTVEHCGILYHCYRAEYYADEDKEPCWIYWATAINADVDCLWFFSYDINKYVRVITKEEAEKALAEREGKELNYTENPKPDYSKFGII